MRSVWQLCSNNLQTAPNTGEETYKGSATRMYSSSIPTCIPQPPQWLPTIRNAECVGQWWMGKKPSGVIASLRSYVEKGLGLQFYGNKDKKAVIMGAPYEPPAESPDSEFDLWLLTGRLACTRFR